MNRDLLRLSVTLALLARAAAEDAPVPPPPPVADPTAPAVNAPVAPTANPAPAKPGSPTPAGGASRGNRTAALAGAASAETQPAVSVRLELTGGYDSNIVLETVNDALDTGLDGLALGANVRGTWRAVRSSTAQLNVIADVRLAAYPEADEANLLRSSVAAFGQLHWGAIDPNALVSAERLWLDGEGLATVARGVIGAARTAADRRSLDALNLEAAWIDLDDNEGASGVLVDLAYRHWFVLDGDNPRRRIEAMLTVGKYLADLDHESFTLVKPTLGVTWRMGDRQPVAGTWDLNANASLELRWYDEGLGGTEAEGQDLWSIGLGADRWWSSWLTTGAYAAYVLRNSSLVGRDYARTQVGVRLGATW